MYKIKGTKKNSIGKSRRFKAIKEGDCIFPFVFGRKKYNQCILDIKKKKYNGERCATELNTDGRLIKWAYCPKTKKKSSSTNSSSSNSSSSNSSSSNSSSSNSSSKGNAKSKKKNKKVSIPESIDIENIRLPKWYNNSCFLDSVIICLLLRPNPYLLNRLLNKPIKKYILSPGKFSNTEHKNRTLELNSNCSVSSREKIRQELINIFNYIHNNIDDDKKINHKSKTGTKFARRLRNFRKSLGDCILRTYEDFTGTEQREANEFLKYLFSMFPDKDKPNLAETVYFTNDIETEIENEEDIKNLEGKVCKSKNKQTTDIYFFISPTDIMMVEELTFLSNFLESKDDSLRPEGSKFLCKSKDYKRSIKFKKFEEKRYIIFDLSRALGDDFLDNDIIPDEEIELSNNKSFRFVSSVYRTPGMGGAHFTSFILLNDIWYYYDDNPGGKKPVFDEIGDYEDLLDYEDGKVTQCVMYFYEPI